MTKKSVFGLDENIASLLCYILGFLSGIVILIMEKENNTVRFHALQSTLWFLALWIVNMIAIRIPLLGGPVSFLIGLLTFASWAFLMYNAYIGKKYKVPIVGDVAEAQINK